MTKIKILYAEDTEEDADLVLAVLKREGYDHDCKVTDSLAEVERLLKAEKFDVMLSDFNLKTFTAMDVLKKRNALAPEIPFIVVTGTLTDEVAVDLLKEGATDYIIKDRISRVCPAIGRVLKDKEEKHKLAAAQAEIKENEARYRELFESSSDLIFLVGLDGTITLSNPAFCNLLGCALGKPAAFKAENLVPEDKRQAFRESLAAASAGVRPGRIVTVFLSEAGKSVEVEGSFYPRVKDSKVLYVQGIFRDLTEQNSLQAQFRQSQKMEAIGRLAGGVAHDFNNMLGAIEGYATLVLNTLKEEDPIKPDIEEIRKAVARAAGLTKQLLTFSRKQAMQKKVCEPNAVADNTRKMLASLLGERVKLQLDLEPELPCLMADPLQLDQMIMNLALNARDAMPEGGVLELRTRLVTLKRQEVLSPDPEEAGRNFIVFTVKDSGIGISAETQEHIFEPFFTTKEKGKGTGLGLPIVYGVAKQHNGWISVASEPGKGSEFSVYFPAKPCAALAEESAQAHRAAATRTNPARVLIIEDDAVLCNLAAKALAEYGHTAEKAGSIAAALAIARERGSSFDIVFSDMVLGDGKVMDAVDELIRLAPKAGFIFTSGYLEEKANWDFINARGYKFIPKPFSVNALLAAIDESREKRAI
jgi:PAS domain S-box-containing protein